MKLVVMIPAYNEEETIADVIAEIPKGLCEVDEIETLVVDDGSTDRTAETARKAGANVVSNEENIGLARTFKKGLEEALARKADIIVNIDADGQYVGGEIPDLIKPILEGRADVVLGSRFKGSIEYMPLHKKIGNSIATKITQFASGVPISDAQTGFRAFSRDAALRLNVMSDYTYVQETIIQAAIKGLGIVEVPCSFRKRNGKSRLISNIFSYAKRAGATILLTYRDYKPLKTFLLIGGSIFFLGLAVGARVLIHFLKTGLVSPYIPSAILTAVLLIIGFQVIILGLVADMIGNNRKILEELLYKLKK
jgi:glycosyltransferase involved in cell wall biosynthesis